MWPIGYIMDNSYSPFRIERELPSMNWRDAFEDLLALEAGRPMIREEYRQAEAEFYSRYNFKHANYMISSINSLLLDRQKSRTKAQVLLKAAEEKGDVEAKDNLTQRLFPALKTDEERLITEAQRARDIFEVNTGAPASKLKPRGQWMASLMSSGALPDWNWSAVITSDGPVVVFDKLSDSGAGFSTSELELIEGCEQGQPHKFGTPCPLPTVAMRAAIEHPYVLAPDMPEDPFRSLRASKSSILGHGAVTEQIKLRDGSIGFKTIITNYLVNGATVKKEFTGEPVKLLEEIEHARLSMTSMRVAVETLSAGSPTLSPLEQALKEWMNRPGAKALAQQEDWASP
ncbi:MAG: hypothetical protein Q9170_006419 [Blastenia crenularia]